MLLSCEDVSAPRHHGDDASSIEFDTVMTKLNCLVKIKRKSTGISFYLLNIMHQSGQVLDRVFCCQLSSKLWALDWRELLGSLSFPSPSPVWRRPQEQLLTRCWVPGSSEWSGELSSSHPQPGPGY